MASVAVLVPFGVCKTAVGLATLRFPGFFDCALPLLFLVPIPIFFGNVAFSAELMKRRVAAFVACTDLGTGQKRVTEVAHVVTVRFVVTVVVDANKRITDIEIRKALATQPFERLVVTMLVFTHKIPV